MLNFTQYTHLLGCLFETHAHLRVYSLKTPSHGLQSLGTFLHESHSYFVDDLKNKSSQVKCEIHTEYTWVWKHQSPLRSHPHTRVLLSFSFFFLCVILLAMI